jgi:hypothetical protein
MLELFAGAVIGSVIGVKSYNKYEFVRDHCKMINKKFNFIQKTNDERKRLKEDHKIQIVEFDEGSFAIRKYDDYYGYEYKDLDDLHSWRGKNSEHIKCCLGTLERCKEGMKRIEDKKNFNEDKGTPVNQ